MRFFNKIKRHFYNKWDWNMDEKIIPNFTNWLAFYLFRKRRKILTINETINYIRFSKCSVARFGDGEFKCVMGGGNGFQNTDLLLAQRLKAMLCDNTFENFLICIPNIDEILRDFDQESIIFWKRFIRLYGIQLTKIMCCKRTFGAAHFTRFYLGRKDKSIAENNIKETKRLWDKKDLLIVEGGLSKLGISNDLLDNAKSVKRIIAPSQNAFSKYDEILQKVLSCYNGELVLIALGQTATVLAYDLSKAGVYAIDIGHIDIEYMWFKMGATERVSIKGKHTAELFDDFSELDAEEETKYRSQIIATII